MLLTAIRSKTVARSVTKVESKDPLSQQRDKDDPQSLYIDKLLEAREQSNR